MKEYIYGKKVNRVGESGPGQLVRRVMMMTLIWFGLLLWWVMSLS